MDRSTVFRAPLTAVLQVLCCALLWLVIAGPSLEAALIGVPTVLFAAWTRYRLAARHPRSWSPRGALLFIPYFVVESVKGGVDVALRVMQPRMPIAPGLHRYRTRLCDHAARATFLNCISLLPGTLSADVQRDIVTVHALDREADILGDLERLERRVAALFGETLPALALPAQCLIRAEEG